MFEKEFNFTFQHFYPIHEKWGGYDSYTGQWDGAVSNLISGDAEVIAAPVTYTKERAEVINFLTPVTKVTYGFVIKGKLKLFQYDFGGCRSHRRSCDFYKREGRSDKLSD